MTLFTGIRSTFLLEPTASEPERLVSVEPGNNNQFSYLNYRDLQDSNIFTDVLGFRSTQLNLRNGTEISIVNGLAVTANFFEMLGVSTHLGRTFLSTEAQAEQEPRLAVLSFAYWQRRFQENPSVIGQFLYLNGQSFLVLGILPKDYHAVTPAFTTPEIYVPASRLILPNLDSRNNGNSLNVIGRLKPGATADQAQSAVTVLNVELERIYPNENRDAGRPATVVRYRTLPLEALVFPLLLMLLCGVVLLIACANVAGLLLAKAANRQREIAVRVALGASRGRLIQSLLAESFILSLIGGGASLLLTFWLMSALGVLNLPTEATLYINLQADVWLYVYAFILVVLTSILCGIIPALKATKGNLAAEIQHGSGHGSTGRLWLRRAFVVGQVAAALTLLVISSLFLRSLVRISSLDPGFDLDNGLVATVHLPASQYSPDRMLLLAQRAVASVAGITGVQSASVANLMPLGNDASVDRFTVEAQDEPGARTGVNTVGPRYFETMGIGLLNGREFQPADSAGAGPVVIVNKAFRDAYFGGGNGIGRRIRIDGDVSAEVIGVVDNSSYRGFGEQPMPLLYYAFTQRPALSTQVRPLFVHVRMNQPTAAAMQAMKRSIEGLDGSVVVEVGTLRQATNFGPALQRTVTSLLGLLGGLGLILSMIGLYGVMSHVVTSRSAEIGIRMALGASPLRVLWSVMGDGLKLVSIGVGIGSAISLALARPLASFLAGLSPADPMSFGGTAVLLILVGLCASYIPARRATRVDPVVALREQ
jgi:putative ABC transport system permease protein